MNQLQSDLLPKIETVLESIKDFAGFDQANLSLFGRQGLFNQYFQQLTSSQKKDFGKEFNLLKTKTLQDLESIKNNLTDSDQKEFDPTSPGDTLSLGSTHLVTQAISEIESIFTKIGFTRRRYPEVELDWYAAEGLNIPKDHPARDDQETFYVSDNIVLTAHTSNGQLREMENSKGILPIRMINIGKTYRRQIDASHTPMFHQFEGMYIDKEISISHLIGVINFFVHEYFGKERTTRLRPHHFQFTEPSFEIDISCGVCGGSGCKLCKAGWLELGGAGMIHPNVLKNGKLDPNKVSGFAFGWGVERVLMMKPDLNLGDIRNLYTDDLRILSQF